MVCLWLSRSRVLPGQHCPPPPLPVAAAEIPYTNNMVSNVKVDDSRLTDSKIVYSNTNLILSFDLTIPDGAKPGDTITLELSDMYAKKSTGELELKTKDGKVIGKVGNQNTKLVITLSENVSDLQNITAHVDVPIGPRTSSDAKTLHKLQLKTQSGKIIDTGKAYKIYESVKVVHHGVIMSSKVNAETREIHVSPSARIGLSGNVKSTTVTFEPDGDNWRFDTKRFKDPQSFIRSIAMDDDTTKHNPKGTLSEAAAFEYEFTGKYKVVSVTPKKLVVQVDDIPEGFNVAIRTTNAFATKVGENEVYAVKVAYSKPDGIGQTNVKHSVRAGTIGGIADAKPVVIEDVEGEEPPTEAPENPPTEKPQDPSTEEPEQPADPPTEEPGDSPTGKPEEPSDPSTKEPEEPAKPANPSLDIPPTITDSDFVETGNPITVTKCEPGADVKFRVTKRGDDTVKPYETTVKADEEGTASFNARGQNRHAKAEYVGMYDVEATCGDKVLKGEFEVTGKPAEGSESREEAPVAEPKNPVVKTGASERWWVNLLKF